MYYVGYIKTVNNSTVTQFTYGNCFPLYMEPTLDIPLGIRILLPHPSPSSLTWLLGQEHLE